jgi:hypothetical protein
MRTAVSFRSVVWWCIASLLFLVAWLVVIPAQSEDVSVVTFYVH